MKNLDFTILTEKMRCSGAIKEYVSKYRKKGEVEIFEQIVSYLNAYYNDHKEMWVENLSGSNEEIYSTGEGVITIKNTMLTDRDIRTIENMARTGMSFDDLRKAFSQFPIEEVEKVYMRIRKETVGNAQAGMKINCS